MAGNGNWGILGGGFGLYGYLPALVDSGEGNVWMAARYKAQLENRPELSRYRDRVRWAASAEEIIRCADSLVFAIPPKAQQELIAGIPPHKTYQSIVLEKPVATTPAYAEMTLRETVAKAGKVRVGFTFQHASWSGSAAAAIASAKTGHFTIHWRFMADHFDRKIITWKADHGSGGGALRFYGIQLLALIAHLFPDAAVVQSRLDYNSAVAAGRWRAQFQTISGVILEVEVDSFCKLRCFEIWADGPKRAPILVMDDPFAQEQRAQNRDRRIEPLKELLTTFQEENEAYYDLYGRVNDLWFAVEQSTTNLRETK